MNRWPLRISLLSLVGVLAVVALPHPCSACSCVAASTPAGGWTHAALIADYDAVFLGRVVEVGPLRDFGGGVTDGTYRVTFAASEVWAGPIRQHYVVQAGSGGGDCTISFQLGQEWLIYGSHGPDGIVVTGICSRTTQQPTDDLSVLGAGTPVTFEAETPTSVAAGTDQRPGVTTGEVNDRLNNDDGDLAKASAPSTDGRALSWQLAGAGVLSMLGLALLLGILLRRRSSVSG